MTRFFIIPIRMWRVLEPQLAAGALILFTPLLVNDQRKVPLSAFGRVRDDTVLYFQLQLARGRVRDDTVVRHLMIWAESGYAHST